MRRVVRTSSFTPSRSSSASMWRPITAGATPSLLATAVRLPLFATATNDSICLSRSMRLDYGESPARFVRHTNRPQRGPPPAAAARCAADCVTERRELSAFARVIKRLGSNRFTLMELKPPSRPRAVLFDAYGTLFDVYSVGALAEASYPGQGERLSLLWRDKQIEYSRLRSMSGRYEPFWDITRDALRFAALRLGLPQDTAREERLLQQYLRLDPFVENRGVLETLRQRGVRTGVLSNGDPGMLEQVIAHAGFSAWLDPVLSVQSTARFKTDPITVYT